MIPALPSAKRILVVHYSQTGQLTALMQQVLAPLQADPLITVTIEHLQPRPSYPFPWPLLDFLDAFPESAHMVAPTLAPLSLTGDEDFDLIILPYQIWFLAPSLPITAFLKHPVAQRVLRQKPVVTLIACRNMWLTAHEKLKDLLVQTGAHLIDNVVLVDPGSDLGTFVTTPVWMLTGRKTGFWGLQNAGLSPAQIQGAARFGHALREGLRQHQERTLQPMLRGLGAVQANPHLYFSEKVGTRSFYLWGHLIRLAGGPGAWPRKPLLLLYLVFLLSIILTVVPISLLVQFLLRPLLKKRMRQMKADFEQPSGSSTERCPLYEVMNT